MGRTVSPFDPGRIARSNGRRFVSDHSALSRGNRRSIPLESVAVLERVAKRGGSDNHIGTRADRRIQTGDRERGFRGFLEANGLVTLGGIALGSFGHFLRGVFDAFAGGSGGGSAAAVTRWSGAAIGRRIVREQTAEAAEELAVTVTAGIAGRSRTRRRTRSRARSFRLARMAREQTGQLTAKTVARPGRARRARRRGGRSATVVARRRCGVVPQHGARQNHESCIHEVTSERGERGRSSLE
jgi:hypothetical protein